MEELSQTFNYQGDSMKPDLCTCGKSGLKTLCAHCKMVKKQDAEIELSKAVDKRETFENQLEILRAVIPLLANVTEVYQRIREVEQAVEDADLEVSKLLDGEALMAKINEQEDTFTIVLNNYHGYIIYLTKTINFGSSTVLCTDGELHTLFEVQSRTTLKIYYNTGEEAEQAIKKYKGR